MFWSVSTQTILCDKESINRLASKAADECGEWSLHSVFDNLSAVSEASFHSVMSTRWVERGRGGGGVIPQKNRVWVRRPLPKTLPYLWLKQVIFPNLFMTKISNIDILLMTQTVEKSYRIPI